MVEQDCLSIENLLWVGKKYNDVSGVFALKNIWNVNKKIE